MSDSKDNELKKCELLDRREKHIVGLYTNDFYDFYDNLNRFLSKRDTLELYQENSMDTYFRYFYHYVTDSNNRQINKSYPRNNSARSTVESQWNNLEWFQKMHYQFTVELFSIIRRCPVLGQNVTVYRGVSQHYLKEDPSNMYNITTFLSTSIDINVSLGFGANIMYEFTVMNHTQCMYIGDYDDDLRENELLINPYTSYIFVSKRNIGERIQYKYILFRSGVQLPGDFQSFMRFRNAIQDRSVPRPARGGSEMGIEPVRNGNRRNGTKNGNTRRMNRKNGNRKRVNTKNGNTRRVNTRRVNTKSVNTNKNRRVNHVRERMTSFIGTSNVGVPLTQEMKEMVQAVREGLERGE